MIWTVSGSLEARELEICMMHEHLVPRETIPKRNGFRRFVEPCGTDDVVRQLRQSRELGLRSVVDVTPFGPERDPETLQAIADESGINVICATGFYKEPRIPAFVYTMAVPEIAEFMVRELTIGIEGSQIRAGIIKVGTSKDRIARVEEKILRAAAAAHKETGAPITTHATLGTCGVEQLDILEEEGVHPSSVIIGHSDLNLSPIYHDRIATRGAFLGIDTVGKERFDYTRVETAGTGRYEILKEHYHIPDQRRLESLCLLIQKGFGQQVILSSDIVRMEAYMNPTTLGSLGYAYLLAEFVPALREHGVTNEHVHRILVENPRKMFEG